MILFISMALPLVSCSKGAAERFSMPPMPVEVAKVKTQKVVDRFEVVGTIQALDEITVAAEIDASVVSLPFQEGGGVRRGDLIAQLDDSELAAEVARTEALRDQSRSNYDRTKGLLELKSATSQDLDNASAALKVAEAYLTVSKTRLAKTRIVAPFSGIIGSRKVSIGTFLRIGQAVTELANIDEIRVKFSAPERFLSQMNYGAEVDVSTTAYPGHDVKGKIIAIEPVLDAETRSIKVIARVPNPGRKFRPGMSATVSAVLSERSQALTIPNEAIFASGNQSFVFVVKADSSVARVAVTLGTRSADVVEVIQGLDSLSQVVRAGHQKLFDGAKVMPIADQNSTSH